MTIKTETAAGSIFNSSDSLFKKPVVNRTISFDGEDLPPEQLPIPTGWRILVAPISIDESTSGGIIITKADQKLLEHIRFVGRVLAVGPLVYKHEKFKTHPDQMVPEPWCRVGDIITTAQYAGSQIPCRVDGKEYNLRVINDDEVNTVITDTGVLNI